MSSYSTSGEGAPPGQGPAHQQRLPPAGGLRDPHSGAGSSLGATSGAGGKEALSLGRKAEDKDCRFSHSPSHRHVLQAPQGQSQRTGPHGQPGGHALAQRGQPGSGGISPPRPQSASAAPAPSRPPRPPNGRAGGRARRKRARLKATAVSAAALAKLRGSRHLHRQPPSSSPQHTAGQRPRVRRGRGAGKARSQARPTSRRSPSLGVRSESNLRSPQAPARSSTSDGPGKQDWSAERADIDG